MESAIFLSNSIFLPTTHHARLCSPVGTILHVVAPVECLGLENLETDG